MANFKTFTTLFSATVLSLTLAGGGGEKSEAPAAPEAVEETSMMEQATEAASGAMDSASEMAGDAMDTVEEVVDGAEETMNDAMDSAAEAMEDADEDAKAAMDSMKGAMDQ